MNKLLICAKAVGYKTAHTESAVWIYDPNNRRIPYDPEHNDAQAMELLKWLLSKRPMQFPRLTMDDGTPTLEHHITLNEAIINAVCAMEGEG